MSENIEWGKFTKSEGRDLGLQVGAEIFWVPREEMGKVSPVFKSMLYGEFQESKKDVVKLSGKEPCHILEMLRCLFPTTGKGMKPVDDGNFELLLPLADEYQIEAVYEQCSALMEQRIARDLNIGETVVLTTMASRYHLKSSVRIGLRKLANIDPSSLYTEQAFNDSPLNIQNGVLTVALFRATRPLPFHELTIVNPVGQFDHASQKCMYCDYSACGFQNCPTHSWNGDNAPDCNPICHTCTMAYGGQATEFVCQCVDPVIKAQLEKYGVL